ARGRACTGAPTPRPPASTCAGVPPRGGSSSSGSSAKNEMTGGRQGALFVIMMVGVAAVGSRATAEVSPSVATGRAPPVVGARPAAAPGRRRAPAPAGAPPPADRPPARGGGEPLDGRPADKPGPGLTAPQAALFLPKEASNSVFAPIVGGTGIVESHHLPERI